MVQGTSSHAGKSILVAALCRIFAQEGFGCSAFQSPEHVPELIRHPRWRRDRSLPGSPGGSGHGITAGGDESGAPQARRRQDGPRWWCWGRPRTAASPREYHRLQASIWGQVTTALHSLRSEYDLVVIEGAGSPAEIKPQATGHRQHAGGPSRHRTRAAGGRHRPGRGLRPVGGDDGVARCRGAGAGEGLCDQQIPGATRPCSTPVSTFWRSEPACRWWGCFPTSRTSTFPKRTPLDWFRKQTAGMRPAVDVAVIRLPHIANFDDFDPLRHQPGVRLRYVSRPADFGDPDLVVVPGSKTTVSDLDWLRAGGIEEEILAARHQGTAGDRHMRRLPDAGDPTPRSRTASSLLNPKHRGWGLLPTSTTFSQGEGHLPDQGAGDRRSRPLERMPGDGGRRL